MAYLDTLLASMFGPGAPLTASAQTSGMGPMQQALADSGGSMLGAAQAPQPAPAAAPSGGGLLGSIFGGGDSGGTWGLQGKGSLGLLGAGAAMLANKGDFGEALGQGIVGGIGGMKSAADMQKQAALDAYAKARTEQTQAGIKASEKDQAIYDQIKQKFLEWSTPKPGATPTAPGTAPQPTAPGTAPQPTAPGATPTAAAPGAPGATPMQPAQFGGPGIANTTAMAPVVPGASTVPGAPDRTQMLQGQQQAALNSLAQRIASMRGRLA